LSSRQDDPVLMRSVLRTPRSLRLEGYLPRYLPTHLPRCLPRCLPTHRPTLARRCRLRVRQGTRLRRTRDFDRRRDDPDGHVVGRDASRVPLLARFGLHRTLRHSLTRRSRHRSLVRWRKPRWRLAQGSSRLGRTLGQGQVLTAWPMRHSLICLRSLQHSLCPQPMRRRYRIGGHWLGLRNYDHARCGGGCHRARDDYYVRDRHHDSLGLACPAYAHLEREAPEHASHRSVVMRGCRVHGDGHARENRDPDDGDHDHD
jgi:hypothetical protein